MLCITPNLIIIIFFLSYYYYSCTMKSGCFGQNFVFSGSDNFAVYGWKIPEFLDQHGNETKYIRRAQLVLHGHRSIVNQVRFNSTYSILGTSGKFCMYIIHHVSLFLGIFFIDFRIEFRIGFRIC